MAQYIQFIFILLALVLAGCNQPDGMCVEADDFGYPKITISSKGGPVIYGIEANQCAAWINTNYALNGNYLQLVVSHYKNLTGLGAGAWSAWHSESGGIADQLIKRLPNSDCANQATSGYCPDPANPGPYVSVVRTDMGPSAIGPMHDCVFTRGAGLYALFANPGQDPNANEYIVRNPNLAGTNYHLGSVLNIPERYEMTGGYSGSTSSIPVASGSSSVMAGQNLYLKILDTYYGDNDGYYVVNLKSGVASAIPGPIATLIGGIKRNLTYASAKLFCSIIDPNTTYNPHSGLCVASGAHVTPSVNYKKLVTICLQLYIIIFAMSFLIGVVNLNHREAVVHIFKIAIVLALFSNQSFQFFYQYLFKLFQEGADTIICIISETTGNSSCNLHQWSSGAESTTISVTDNTFGFFDSLLGEFFSFETSAKIVSLIFPSVSGGWPFSGTFLGGIAMVIGIYIAIAFYVIAIFKAVIMYLIAYVGIALLITLAPIFLVFILFSSTKSLFDNWLKIIAGYAMQTIIIFAFIIMMSQVMLNEFHKLLGYRVCFNPVITIPTINLKLFSFWLPDLTILAELNAGRTSPVQVPETWVQGPDGNSVAMNAYQIATNTVKDTICRPYECTAIRYPDLPFLDPVADASRINNIQHGNFVQWSDFFLFFFVVFLMMQFNDAVPMLARGLSQLGSGYMGGLGGLGIKSLQDLFKGGYEAFTGKNFNEAYNSRIKAGRQNIDDRLDKWTKNLAGSGKIGTALVYTGQGISAVASGISTIATTESATAIKAVWSHAAKKSLGMSTELKMTGGENKVEAIAKILWNKSVDKLNPNLMASPLYNPGGAAVDQLTGKVRSDLNKMSKTNSGLKTSLSIYDKLSAKSIFEKLSNVSALGEDSIKRRGDRLQAKYDLLSMTTSNFTNKLTFGLFGENMNKVEIAGFGRSRYDVALRNYKDAYMIDGAKVTGAYKMHENGDYYMPDGKTTTKNKAEAMVRERSVMELEARTRQEMMAMGIKDAEAFKFTAKQEKDLMDINRKHREQLELNLGMSKANIDNCGNKLPYAAAGAALSGVGLVPAAYYGGQYLKEVIRARGLISSGNDALDIERLAALEKIIGEFPKAGEAQEPEAAGRQDREEGKGREDAAAQEKEKEKEKEKLLNQNNQKTGDKTVQAEVPAQGQPQEQAAVPNNDQRTIEQARAELLNANNPAAQVFTGGDEYHVPGDPSNALTHSNTPDQPNTETTISRPGDAADKTDLLNAQSTQEQAVSSTGEEKTPINVIEPEKAEVQDRSGDAAKIDLLNAQSMQEQAASSIREEKTPINVIEPEKAEVQGRSGDAAKIDLLNAQSILEQAASSIREDKAPINVIEPEKAEIQGRTGDADHRADLRPEEKTLPIQGNSTGDEKNISTSNLGSTAEAIKAQSESIAQNITDANAGGSLQGQKDDIRQDILNEYDKNATANNNNNQGRSELDHKH